MQRVLRAMDRFHSWWKLSFRSPCFIARLEIYNGVNDFQNRAETGLLALQFAHHWELDTAACEQVFHENFNFRDNSN